MNLLRYEFIDGPEGSINDMIKALVKELRYNRSQLTIEKYRQALPALQAIESQLQKFDADIRLPRRNYITEILEELDQESENEVNIVDDLYKAANAVIDSLFGHGINFHDFSYSTGKAEHYHWIQFLGYSDQRPVDADLIIIKEVFRSISNKYQYIFIDLS